MRTTRRQFLTSSAAFGAGLVLPGLYGQGAAFSKALALALSDPAIQPKFVETAPNALDPGFLLKGMKDRGAAAGRPDYRLRASAAWQETGLIDPRNKRKLRTKVWGYGEQAVTWPGPTFQVMSTSAGGPPETTVRWVNEIEDREHLLPVDRSLHWCYALHGKSSRNGVDYRKFSIKEHGVPMVPHLHGGHSDFQYDGNPEFFFSPGNQVRGPQWALVPGGFTNLFRYDNNVRAGNLWYHDHALGITRLNVYAGLAGFYFVRDEYDTGKVDNPLDLPAFPYELAYAIQDRMFTLKGELFFSAFPGDPFYKSFITDEDVKLPSDLFPNGGPTALAEFFGDHIVVNGKIWPKANVEPRHYRMRLLHGSDSRFIVLRFRATEAGATDLAGAGAPLSFHVIGSDQGLAANANETTLLVLESGGRYDIVVDFSDPALAGKRIIMENAGGDTPFGGTFGENLAPEDVFANRQTDRIMAFDVVLPLDSSIPDRFDPAAFTARASQLGFGPPDLGAETNTRRVGLFEGKDEFGRLQPLLGTVADDLSGATPYTWFQETTETPRLGATEIWEIFNFTADAHPVHLHLVSFAILGRNTLSFDSDDGDPGQPITQHDGTQGRAPVISNISVGNAVALGAIYGYVENTPKDVVTALPGQVTRIKAHFDKPGRYVWHCHLLSHEDHEMMRILEVVAPD